MKHVFYFLAIMALGIVAAVGLLSEPASGGSPARWFVAMAASKAAGFSAAVAAWRLLLCWERTERRERSEKHV